MGCKTSCKNKKDQLEFFVHSLIISVDQMSFTFLVQTVLAIKLQPNNEQIWIGTSEHRRDMIFLKLSN